MTTLNDLLSRYTQQSQMSNFYVDKMGIYNVKSYGATGDGTTDDSDAIETAIAAIKTNGGGQLYFPVGTYVITTEVLIDFDNIEICGCGPGSIISCQTPDITAGLRATGTFYCLGADVDNKLKNISIHDLYFQGAIVNTVLNILLFKWVENVNVYNNTIDCIDTIQHCIGVGLGDGSDGYSININIFNNRLIDPFMLGISYNGCSYGSVYNNNISGCGEQGILLGIENGTTKYNAVFGNIIYDCTLAGIQLISTPPLESQNVSYNVIFGNNISDCGGGIDVFSSVTSSNIIEGNSIHACGTALKIDGATNQVKSNKLNGTGVGVYYYTDNVSTYFHGNHVSVSSSGTLFVEESSNIRNSQLYKDNIGMPYNFESNFNLAGLWGTNYSLDDSNLVFPAASTGTTIVNVPVSNNYTQSEDGKIVSLILTVYSNAQSNITLSFKSRGVLASSVTTIKTVTTANTTGDATVTLTLDDTVTLDPNNSYWAYVSWPTSDAASRIYSLKATHEGR